MNMQQFKRWRRLKVTEDLIRQVQTDSFVGLKNRVTTQEEVRETILAFTCEVTRLMMTVTNPPIQPKKKK